MTKIRKTHTGQKTLPLKTRNNYRLQKNFKLGALNIMTYFNYIHIS